MTIALGVGMASAAKEVTDSVGADSFGGLGGQFSNPRDVAANETGAGPAEAGDFYVADDGNRRIQRFAADGDFISAWGANVIQAGKPGNLDEADPLIGANPFEICTVAADCQQGASSGGNGLASGNGSLTSPQSVAVDQDTGLVYVSDRLSRRINVYAGDGAFQFSVGRDVQDPDGGTAVEICGDVAGDVCRTADGGAGPGEIGASSTSGTLGIAVSPPDANPATGKVFLADTQNRRVNTYNLDGTSPSSFGTAGTTPKTFGSSQPRKIAVDSRGIVYASNSNENAEIERYDSAGVNGPVDFLAPIASPPLLVPGSTATGTSGLAVDPDSDGAGSDEDVLYVLRDPAEGNTVVQQFGPVNDPGLSAAPSAVDDTHGAGAGFQTVNGLGSDASSGRLFVSTSGTTAGAKGPRVYLLANVVAPTATISPATGVSSTTATFSGQVNPGGAPTRYSFQYVDDPEFQANGFANAQATFPEEAGSGSSPALVSKAVSGLAPNTLYHVRLVATHVFDPASGTSAPATFTTGASAPFVAPSADADATATTATLMGRVTPNGQATTYRFEWGTTSSYGNSTPAQAAGAGIDSVQASASLSGLAPSTTYHFRLLATNASGTTEGGDHTFTTEAPQPAVCPNQQFRQGPSAGLPDCRAYEQVSPVDKNSSDVQGTLRGVSVNGDAAIFTSQGSFAGHPAGGGALDPDSFYYSSRDGARWTTVPGTPRPTSTVAARGLISVSPDLGKALYVNYQHAFEPDADPLPGLSSFYVRNNQDGSTSRLVDTDDSAGVSFAASEDLSHVAFASRLVLGSEPDVPPTGYKVYEIVDGSIRLVSRRPGTDEPFESEALLAGHVSGRPSFGTSSWVASSPRGAGAVSKDGSKIFFETPADSPGSASGGPSSDTSLIYRRSDGVTQLASPSQRTSADPLGPRKKIFRRATPDGRTVFFTSSELLTDDANTGPAREGVDLYRYDMDTEELRDISATTGGNGAQVDGVVGISKDGNRVYYVGLGVIAPGGSEGQRNLYLWEDDGSSSGHNRFIATLGPYSDHQAEGDATNYLTNSGSSRVTPDGRYLAFASTEALTGYDNVDPITGARGYEFFRYDAIADSLICASCIPGGQPSGKPSDISGGSQLFPRALSNDGRYLFFNTADPLVAGDTNGLMDAYVWTDGSAHLLSSGTSTSVSRFTDASADGRRAFFTTRSQLVPQDEDHNVDIYVAAVNGGLLSQQEILRPSCEGEACRGAGSVPPAAQSPLTPAFAGKGNTPKRPPKCGKGKRKVKTRNGKTRCVKRQAKSRRGNDKRNASKAGRASR
jgi:Tol biopolymer transport system component